MSTCFRRYWIQKWEQKYECSHSITLRTMTISHFHVRKLIFWTYHPKSMPTLSYPHVVHFPLIYEEDNTSSLPIENHSTENDILAHHLPSIAEEDDDTEEHSPAVSLDDDFWMEEPVPERHPCIHEDAQHDLCPYPCPYDLN